MSSRLYRRLLSELHDYNSTSSSSVEDNNGLIHLAPISDENLLEWSAIIRGPTDTAFANINFELKILLTTNYPASPPLISFTSPLRIFHPNVAIKTGEICLDVLKEQWSPVWTLSSACWAIQALLGDPESSSPLNIDAANLLRAEDRLGFDSMVKMFLLAG